MPPRKTKPKGADIRGRLDEQTWARVRAFQELHPAKNDSVLVRDALESYLNAMELEDARRAAELAGLTSRPETHYVTGERVRPRRKPLKPSRH